jgi:hypothetical protein
MGYFMITIDIICLKEPVSKIRDRLFLFGEGLEKIFVPVILKAYFLVMLLLHFLQQLKNG